MRSIVARQLTSIDRPSLRLLIPFSKSCPFKFLACVHQLDRLRYLDWDIRSRSLRHLQDYEVLWLGPAWDENAWTKSGTVGSGHHGWRKIKFTMIRDRSTLVNGTCKTTQDSPLTRPTAKTPDKFWSDSRMTEEVPLVTQLQDQVQDLLVVLLF